MADAMPSGGDAGSPMDGSMSDASADASTDAAADGAPEAGAPTCGRDGGAPCPDDGNPCTWETCLEGACVSMPAPRGVLCGDGRVCDGDGGCTEAAVRGRVLTVGTGHSCAVRAGGELWCWGWNSDGQLGDGTFDDRRQPVRVLDLGFVVAVAAGHQHTCALDAGGRMWCWGSTLWGQRGDGSIGWAYDEPRPVLVERLSDVRLVAAGGHDSCAVAGPDLQAYCWGAAASGQLGADTFDRQVYPVPVGPMGGPPLTGVVSLDPSDSTSPEGHGCFVLASGEARCAGGAERLGSTVDTVDQRVPVAVEGRADFVEVATSWYGACGRTIAGQVYCWGRDPPMEAVSLPQPARRIAAGWNHYCALLADGTVWCWGRGGQGQLGNGGTSDAATPVRAGALTEVVEVACGSSRSCALRADGSVWCWGENRHGGVGDGTILNRLEPVRVVGLP